MTTVVPDIRSKHRNPHHGGRGRQIFIAVLVLTALLTAPACAAESIKIASIFAFTGAAASSNRYAAAGVRFGVADINRRGGIQGQAVELIEIDNHSTPIGSKVAADQAVAAGVTAIVGATWSSHSLAIARVAQAHQIPMITPDSTHIDVTRVGDYIFRACFTDPFQGRVLARFAREALQAATAVVFTNITSDYSMGLAEAFRHDFTRRGGTILTEIPYEHQQENFAREAAQAAALQPDVLFIPGHDEESIALLKAVREAGLRAIPIGADGWNTEKFYQGAGSVVARAYFSTHWTEESPDARARQFVAAHKQPGEPLSDASLGYDAVLLLADAMRRAGRPERRLIRDALAATRNFPGVTGKITFDSHGDPVKPVVIMEIKKGAYRIFATITP
jgi:branched-chain amino acid transport system substrate-binding protein